MLFVMLAWLAALISGLVLPRWVTFVGCTIATGALFFLPESRTTLGLLKGMMIFGSPWILALQHDRNKGVWKTLLAEESFHMMRLSDSTRELLALRSTHKQLEEAVQNLANLYHVTQETSREIRVKPMFTNLAQSLYELLPFEKCALIVVEKGADSCHAARLKKDGTIHIDERDALSDDEQIMVKSAQQFRLGHRESSIQRTVKNASVWIPLWYENSLIGIFCLEGYDPEHEKLIKVVADQLTLQISRVLLYQRVEALAVTDDLTGVFVRSHFERHAEDEIKRCRRHDLKCSLLMVDLDLFKNKNDTYGHLVGDVILREVASLLQSNLRDFDLIARYGGEEFLILIIESDLEQTLPAAERLRQLVEVRPIRAYDELIRQTISIGIASYPQHADSYPQLLELADQALLQAKRLGRNRVVCAEPTI